ncbi:response regulator containing a CheY-like receiver domain and an HTH DNA-binding domain [Rhizobium leguminosarum bv. trifolii WSM2297]|uniref:Response regulator containing a CheY-like receiver domain and an HTH DNA-binding domain n=1 Tax=Rhizobium leguminosarum bv. trifolii WSM2297 TaxID=754762 RepID=J0CNT0_RHILT|nr:LuxR C-terminal-related transcriptional regulator [Rhizobium leguminosarum]EJC85572.1 response regulator containing a CheY-like receiver domain and an HTH DNA-binding domain [Rhizobium leguminosarum bv. trifolii WSM2297]
MSIDLEGLFQSFDATVGKSVMTDAEFGETFRRMMAALVRFDYVVVFAYRGKELPIDLYSTFDPEENVVFVTLYQIGPYLLDPFYQTARARRSGVFRMRELAPDRFFSSEYYRSYYVQTGLAEEIGFFVTLDDDITVVLSLMRREKTGPFPPAEFALLKKAEPLVARLVRHFWPGLGARFDAQLEAGMRGKKRGAAAQVLQPADTVWRDLKLTSRETAIVDLVLQGHSSESIGLRLNISTGTVKVHRRNVYRKLGISSQTQLLSIYLKTFGSAGDRPAPQSAGR